MITEVHSLRLRKIALTPENEVSKAIDRLRDMALFAEVAKTGSFTKASLSLGVPTSMLSRQVSAFECDIKVRLFNCTTRRLTSALWPTIAVGGLVKRSRALGRSSEGRLRARLPSMIWAR